MPRKAAKIEVSARRSHRPCDVDAEVAGNLGYQSTLVDQAKGIEIELTRIFFATPWNANHFRGTPNVPP